MKNLLKAVWDWLRAAWAGDNFWNEENRSVDPVSEESPKTAQDKTPRKSV
jgi:hypothetical protein